jgi:hypothetical protein
MSQTPEIRIRLHYRAIKRRWGRDLGSKGRMFMHLARWWKRPVQEIKKIVRGGTARPEAFAVVKPSSGTHQEFSLSDLNRHLSQQDLDEIAQKSHW